MTISNNGQPLAVRMYDVIKQFPEGIASFEVKELFPDEGWANAVHGTLNTLKARGSVKVIGKRYPQGRNKNPASVYVATDVLPSGRTTRKRTKPTAAGWDARLSEANKRIAELEAWKAGAIARFPDLAIAPALAEARKRVATMLRNEGDSMKANQAMQGLMDHSMLVRAVMATIEDLAA